MNPDDFINLKYANLCQQLGDAHIKRQVLEDQIENLEDEIRALDKMAPELKFMIQQASSLKKSESPLPQNVHPLKPKETPDDNSRE